MVVIWEVLIHNLPMEWAGLSGTTLISSLFAVEDVLEYHCLDLLELLTRVVFSVVTNQTIHTPKNDFFGKVNCLLSNEVCSNYISPVVFFVWAIFRLTHLTFRFQKRDKQVTPGGNYFLGSSGEIMLSEKKKNFLRIDYSLKGGSWNFEHKENKFCQVVWWAVYDFTTWSHTVSASNALEFSFLTVLVWNNRLLLEKEHQFSQLKIVVIQL